MHFGFLAELNRAIRLVCWPVFLKELKEEIGARRALTSATFERGRTCKLNVEL